MYKKLVDICLLCVGFSMCGTELKIYHGSVLDVIGYRKSNVEAFIKNLSIKELETTVRKLRAIKEKYDEGQKSVDLLSNTRIRLDEETKKELGIEKVSNWKIYFILTHDFGLYEDALQVIRDSESE